MVSYRSTNPESVNSSRDPACLRRHARSLEESHNPTKRGREMTEPRFSCPKKVDSSRDLLCLRRHARSLWYYIGRPTRKVSFPQEIPHVFEGTLDLLRKRIIPLRFALGETTRNLSLSDPETSIFSRKLVCLRRHARSLLETRFTHSKTQSGVNPSGDRFSLKPTRTLSP